MFHSIALLALVASADAPAQSRERIANPGYFDVGVCAPRLPHITRPDSKESLQAALQASRAELLECLTDPKSRGPAPQTTIQVQGTLGDSGVKASIGGTNLTPAGTACLQKAADSYLARFPSLKRAAGAAPLTATATFQHAAGAMPSAQLGINDASDVVAQIRLAQPGWCDCYPSAASAAPVAILKGQVKLARTDAAQVAPAAVTFEPSGNPDGDKIAACLKRKVMAMKFKSPENELIVPLIVRLIDSAVDGKLPLATPDLQFAQYDLDTNHAVAQSFADDGARVAAAEAFQKTAQGYNAHKKGLKLSDVATACHALIHADDGVVAANQRLAELGKEIHAFTSELKAKDPAWSNAEAAWAKRQQAFEAQLASVQKIHDDDSAHCKSIDAQESAPVTPKKSKKKKSKG